MTTPALSPPARPTSIQVELPNNPRSAVRARHAVDALGAKAHPETLARARLLITEMVAAGIADTASATLTLTLTGSSGAVRAELTTGPARRPQPSGWGRFLVDRLADRWGVTRPGTVWFEVNDKRRRRFARDGASATAGRARSADPAWR